MPSIFGQYGGYSAGFGRRRNPMTADNRFAALTGMGGPGDISLTTGVARRASPGILRGLARPGSIGTQPILQGNFTTPAIQQTDDMIGAVRDFRGRQPGVNLTAQGMAPPAPGGYSGVKIGGGLRLRGINGEPSPGLASALGMRPAQAAPAQAPPAAYVSPGGQAYSSEDLMGISNRGDAAARSVASRSTRGTVAEPGRPYIDDLGNEIAVTRLRGSGQGRPMDMDKRNAYLDAAAQENAFRQSLVLENAQRRGDARRSRLEARKRGLSPLEMMAARNPALALRLAEMQQRGALAREGMGLRERLGMGELGLRDKYGANPLDIAKQQGDNAANVATISGRSTVDAAKARADAEAKLGRAALLEQDIRNPNLSQTERAQKKAELDRIYSQQEAANPAAAVSPAVAAATGISPAAVESDLQPFVDRDDPEGARDFMRNTLGWDDQRIDKELNSRFSGIFPTRSTQNPTGNWFGPGQFTQRDRQGRVSPSLIGHGLNAVFGTQYGIPEDQQKQRKSRIPSWLRSSLGVRGMLAR